MTEAITDSAGLSGPVTEKAAPRKRSASGASRATKKAAKEAPVPVENVVIEEAEEKIINDDGQKVIAGPKKQRTARKSNSFVTESGAVGSRAADAALNRKVDASSKEDISEKVALWSSKNMRWSSVGEVSKGYNIVKKEAAEKWLTMAGIREATPEEVASHYGK